MSRISRLVLVLVLLVVMAPPAWAQTWTAPRTWVHGELVTETQLNQQIRDNELILKTSISNNGLTWSGAVTLPNAVKVSGTKTDNVTVKSLAYIDGSDHVIVGDDTDTLATILRGVSISLGTNNVALYGKTTAAVLRSLARLDSSDHVILGDDTDTVATILRGASISLGTNNVALYGKTTGAVLRSLVYLNNSDHVILGDNTNTIPTDIYGSALAYLGGGTVALGAGAVTGSTYNGQTISSAAHLTGTAQIDSHVKLGSANITDSVGTPTIASGFGSSPVVIGKDYGFRITPGFGTYPTGRITFAATFSNAPSCIASSDTDGAGPFTLSSTTTYVDITSHGSNITPGSYIYVLCRGY